MHEGRTVLAQLLDYLTRHALRRIAERYDGNRRVRQPTVWDHFVVMAFAQLTYRESLRDIEACLGAMSDKLYHSGLRCGPIARSTLADANERRDWRIYADFGYTLISEARRLYTGEPWALELEQTVYALDATIIDLCLSVFPWAHFRRAKGAIKLHVLLDIATRIPAFVCVTHAKTKDDSVHRSAASGTWRYLWDPGLFHTYSHRQLDNRGRFATRSSPSPSLGRLSGRPFGEPGDAWPLHRCPCGEVDARRRKARRVHG